MLHPPASNLAGVSLAAASSALAQSLAQHDDQTVLQALLLLVSQRPELQASLLSVLQEPPAQRYVGIIKSFWVEKHYGFIQCDQLKEQFDADVFLSDLEVGAFAVGSEVSFSVMLNKDGRPQAKMLEAVDTNTTLVEPVQLAPSAQMHRPPREGGGARPAPLMQLRQTPPPPAAPKRVASWGGEASWEGEAPAPLKAPRLHMALSPPPAPGSLPAPPAPFAAAPLSLSRSSCEVPAELAEAVPQPGVAEHFFGTVKSFFPEKHYGFIDCPEFHKSHGCDVFLSSFEISEFQPGDPVVFTITYNRNGRPQAHNLQRPE